TQDRSRGEPPAMPAGEFANVPDTDWTLVANRDWITAAVAARDDAAPVEIAWGETGGETRSGRDPSRPGREAYRYAVADEAAVDRALATAVTAGRSWAARPVEDRAAVLRNVAVEIARRRGEAVATMVMDAGKAVPEGDVEVSEAIDFANYYALALQGEEWSDGIAGEPLGVVVVTPPWNFPFAIPCGGVLAALMAGNAVILKPASESVLTAWCLCECLWAAGVPRDALQFLPAPGGGAGSALVTDDRVGGVILTGALETAQKFFDLDPKMRLFAETSGKNSMVITAAADLDLAIKDLVQSAFGHSGQKCSAASLAVVEAEVYDHPDFRRQLADAARSWVVGPSWDLASRVTPVIRPAGDDLERGLTALDDGEEWLLEPRQDPDNPNLWSPGIRLGVQPGSWFHRTECFGPVLGLIRVENLEEAIAVQNASDFGLTGGIQSLDPREIDRWIEEVEVGNAYVNRGTTGAIVRRQPFGGWKKSVIGPGAKAGGPNYVRQFARWGETGLPHLGATERDEVRELLSRLVEIFPESGEWLRAAARSDAHWWGCEFSRQHDPSQLFCEKNLFRYRPVQKVICRLDPADAARAGRLLLAGRCCGVAVELSCPDECPSLAEWGVRVESAAALARRVLDDTGPMARVRTLIDEPDVRRACHTGPVPIIDGTVLANGRLELLSFLHEQSVTVTAHRYGNIVE
ncbi:MAG: aldehyde dehydrogenase family protein, partial [Akkermansiaceae bacterium]|nr:aldehyde dehydrogenase family protein [Akkermansiaceae bacterium]